MALSTLIFSISACQKEASKPTAQLWYNQPADEWLQSLPVGNGRLGAMIYGGVESETISLNESTMWSGQYNPDQDKPFGKEKFKHLRQLFFDKKIKEGNDIAVHNLNGNQTMFGTHLPIGDLKIDFTYTDGEMKDYRRSLSLDDAVSNVSFTKGDITYSREYFSSNPDKVMVSYLSADKDGAINMSIGLDLLRQADISVQDNQLIFRGKVNFPAQGPGGVNFEGRIAVINDGGTITNDSTTISIENANSVMLISDVRTDYKLPDYQQVIVDEINAASKKSYAELRKAHIDDYTPLYNRVSIEFGKDNHADIPTDQRLNSVKEGATDTGLDVIFFQYGRYLTIASSREDSPLPIALQGFFNDNKACNMPWTNDYHLDINTQQNYWATNIGNLAECNDPLFRYIADLATYGEKTAQTVYGAKGWTAHTTANVWGYSAPSSAIYWGLHPTASSWIASHLWTHYEYTLDKKFLAQTAYPLLKGNAEFLLDIMAEDPNTGYLVTGPSVSPENSFRYTDGNEYSASLMPSVDRQLVYEIFNACIQSSKILDTDKEFCATLEKAIAKLPPIRVGKNGGIMEWYEDYDEAHPNHRHTSHLLALYPYSQITLEQTPELAKGALTTIEKRLATPDWEDTEWSRANMICFFARLKETQRAYESVQLLQGKLSRENLMTISPKGIAGAPWDIFAFDGNTAGTAGMAEMLIQTNEGYVEFLPCLPKQWNTGSYNGLCIRGGGEVASRWKDSVIEYASIKSNADHTYKVKVPQGRQYRFHINGEEKALETDTLGLITVELKQDDLLEIK